MNQQKQPLGENQLRWCKEKLGNFMIIEKQSSAAREDTKRYHDQYLIYETPDRKVWQ